MYVLYGGMNSSDRGSLHYGSMVLKEDMRRIREVVLLAGISYVVQLTSNYEC